MNNNNKECAAYVAASIIAPLGFKSLLEALKAWEQTYDVVAEKMGVEEEMPKVERTTEGGRQIKVITQDEVQAKVVQAQRGRIIPIRSGELPSDAVVWAEKRGVEFVYDNREAQKENPKRPAFKATDSTGRDIKTEDGKSLSYWGTDK